MRTASSYYPNVDGDRTRKAAEDGALLRLRNAELMRPDDDTPMGEPITNERISFRPPLPTSRRARLGLAFFAVISAWWVVRAVLDQSVLNDVYGLAGVIYLSYQLVKYRKGVSADSAGLHRPLHRVLPWDQVHAIDEPSQLRPELVLWCTDARRRGTLLPIEYADELSRISGKPIQTEKALQRPLPKVEVRKTWQQEQDDFVARAAQVKARNAELLGDTETPRGPGG